MLATKVCQRPLQPHGTTSRADANSSGQQAQVTFLAAAPDPLSDTHQPEYTPPLQRFFLRARADASFCSNCSPNRFSALTAQLPMVVLPKRRISSIKSPSTSSALFTGPSALALSSRML